MHGDAKPLSLRQPVDCVLQGAVLERRHFAAALANRVMMMLTVRGGGLVARGLSDVETPHELEPGEQLERPVNARDAHLAVVRTKAVENLLCRQAAVLAGEKLQHGGARASRAMTGTRQHGRGVLLPLDAALLFVRHRHQSMIAGIIRER